ncbi:MAG: SpoIIE family protein phosphatase [Bacteroidia bacterium]
MRKFLRLLLLFCWLIPAAGLGQDRARLRAAVKHLETAAEDTNKVNWLNDIAWDTSYDDLAVGRKYVEQAIKLAEKLSYKRGLVKSYNVLGAIALDMGDLDLSLGSHLNCIRLADSLGLKKAVASAYMNLSNVYVTQKNDSLVYASLTKSISIYRELKSISGLSVALTNLGNWYYNQDSISQSYEAHLEALKYGEETHFINEIGYSLSGLARCEAKRGNAAEAIKLMRRAYQTIDTTHNKYEMGWVNSDFAIMYRSLEQFDSSEYYFRKSIEIYEQLKAPSKLQNVYQDMAILFEKKGNWQQALFYTRKATTLKDSLQTERVLQHQRDMETLYKLNEKEQYISLLNHQKSSQRIYLWVAIAGCVLMLLFLGVLFNRNKLRQKTNSLLEVQKSQLEVQNATIEEKNKSITDSINYAHRIQSALWPRAQDFEQYLHSGFVLLKPKDIVSGDFYWLAERDGYIFVATVDCTGHGVPGGFMSMLGSLLLTEIISDKGIIEPAEVLGQLRTRVISALRQTGDSNDSKDGMDMVLLRYDKSNRQLTYSAANNSFYIINEGELKEMRPDKQPVGYHLEMKPFTQHSLTLESTAQVYTFTDGIADQFGGPAGKKFKYKQFREALIKSSGMNMGLQELELIKELEKWQGSHEQVDDILVMAIKFL